MRLTLGLGFTGAGGASASANALRLRDTALIYDRSGATIETRV